MPAKTPTRKRPPIHKREARTCYAHGCETKIQASMLMCRAHWFSVPAALRSAIWSTYQRGQETGKPRPSPEYIANIREAQRLIAEREGKQAPENA